MSSEDEYNPFNCWTCNSLKLSRKSVWHCWEPGRNCFLFDGCANWQEKLEEDNIDPKKQRKIK